MVLVKSFYRWSHLKQKHKKKYAFATAAGILKELSSLVKEYGDNLSPYLGRFMAKL